MKGKITILMLEQSQFYSTNIYYLQSSSNCLESNPLTRPPIPAVRGVVLPALRGQRLYASPSMLQKYKALSLHKTVI